MKALNIPYVKTFQQTKIIGVEHIDFGKYIILDDFTFIYTKEKMIIGDYVHIASFSSISGAGECIIEDLCAISSGCRIFTSSDDFTQHGFGNSTICNTFRNLTTKPIHIKKFSIIGANSVILPGVIIGEGVSVAANSVVSKNLAPWGIYLGNKRIGERKKSEIMKNYEKFLNLSEDEKMGSLFQK